MNFDEIYNDIDNIILDEEKIDLILITIISRQRENKNLNLEEDFLKIYKLRKNKSSFNYIFFNSFIDSNWKNAVKYSLENIDLELITKDTIVDIECIRRCIQENRPEMLLLILENRKEILDFLNKNKMVTNYLELAIQEKKYRISTILIQHQCFIDVFRYFYKGSKKECELEINEIIKISNNIKNIDNF